MKIIEQTAERWDQGEMFEHIERCARVCYKSEDKMKGEPLDFVRKLINNGHYAMLEHGTVYLTYTSDSYTTVARFFDKYNANPYSEARLINNTAYITTNYRVLLERKWTDDMVYFNHFKEGYHAKRITLKLITSIGIVRELLRHRKFSFANESTRYCNYNKKGEFCFIKPYWYDLSTDPNKSWLDDVCHEGVVVYNNLLEAGLPPQAAREVLPLCTKSELVMTGFTADWVDFLDKRLLSKTGNPHPDMVELSKKIVKALNWEMSLNQK